MKIEFSLGGALLRGLRTVWQNKRKSAILVVLEIVIFGALVAIPISQILPFYAAIFSPAYGAATGEIPGLEAFTRYFVALGAILPFSIAFYVINDAAWHRLLTGKPTGFFPYRLSRDELRVAGVYALVFATMIVACLPIWALLLLLVLGDAQYIWVGFILMPFVWIAVLLLGTRIAPLSPFVVLTGKFRPLTAFRLAGGIWGRLLGAYVILVGGLFAAQLLFMLLTMPFFLGMMMTQIGSETALEDGSYFTTFMVMQGVNMAINVVLTMIFAVMSRGVAAEAAIALHQHELERAGTEPLPLS